MIFKWDLEPTEEMFAYTESAWLRSYLEYVIDWRGARKSVWLKTWLEDQVTKPDRTLVDLAQKLSKGYTKHDDIVIMLLRHVQSILKYTTDKTRWKVEEVWQPAALTLALKTGDCEDGAVLLYVLCRLCGIPKNRLLLLAGDVVGGGHCWLAYKPEYYPINWVFLDWCYWYDSSHIDPRSKFWIIDKTVYGQDPRYKSIWFAFNEDYSYSGILPRFNK
jgi:transglutaminase-like putative cysteine protease